MGGRGQDDLVLSGRSDVRQSCQGDIYWGSCINWTCGQSDLGLLYGQDPNVLAQDRRGPCPTQVPAAHGERDRALRLRLLGRRAVTSYGWVECVGCADRSAFDLTQHTKATGVRLCAEKKLPAPVTKDVTEIVPNKGPLGKAFKKEAKAVTDRLAGLSLDEITKMETELESGMASLSLGDYTVYLSKDIIAVKRYQKTVHVEEIIPSVIEPSFGVGRIMYALFEHNFRVREGDEARTYFSLPPVIAPLKCSLLPLSNNPDFAPIVSQLSQSLTQADISHRVDDSSGSIGKRYARTDEVAVPYGITVDFDSLRAPHSVTLRERDSTTQIRIGVTEVADVVRQLATGRTDWQQVTQKFPKFEAQETKSVAPATVDCSMFPVDSEKEREVLEAHLQTRSYIQGFTIGDEDYKEARALSRSLGGDLLTEVGENTRRWWTHVKSHM